MDFAAIKERARCNAEAREVPLLGQTLHFKRISLAERDTLAAAVIDASGKVTPKSMIGHKARQVAVCWVNADGTPVADEAELSTWAPDVIEALYEASSAVNGLAPGADEDAAKN